MSIVCRLGSLLHFARLGSLIGGLTLYTAVSAAESKDFAPGVRVNWELREVHVDGKVVFRQGPLELIACSPRSREHESILVVPARPLHIYQALGLIGLDPGSPVRYDEKTQTLIPAKGEPMQVLVRHPKDGADRTVPIERWLMDSKSRKSPSSIPWVFAGSRTDENDRFAADSDGTVICVVDFDTALIAVGALHSAENESLWLSANTDEIPPIGTECTLILRPIRVPIRVRVETDGTLTYANHKTSPPALADLLGQWTKEGRKPHITLQPADSTSRESIQKALEALIKAGVNREFLDIESPTPTPE